MKKSKEILALPIATADGAFVAHYSNEGLCGLEFPKAGKGRSYVPLKIPSRLQAWHEQTSRAVERALLGKSPGKLPPLDLSGGSEFQQRVWGVLAGIGRGSTLSYGQVASAIGQPNAVRAVGGACGANPIPVLVPCHRVLAANRRIGGFSGGLEWKQKLLRREGIFNLISA